MAKVFISYNHKDSRWLERLRVHLRPLEREGEIEVWDDRRIKPGMIWLDEIRRALNEARVAVLLVSADFLASEFIMSVEVATLLTKAESVGCRIIPVILRPCRFSDIYVLQRFQAINSPKQPLAKLRSAGAEEYLVTLSREIFDTTSAEKEGRRARAVKENEPSVSCNPRVEALIGGVGLGDWASAERAALEIIALTDSNGKNAIFTALLDYQDRGTDDELLWSALHTIECCAKLAPWLLDHEHLSRMAGHKNFSVRSTAASICMELAQFSHDRARIDLLLRLSRYDEDWYVEAPANAALKAMAQACPAVLQIFYKRLRSTQKLERAHAAATIRDVAEKEAHIFDISQLEEERRQLRALGDKEAIVLIGVAIARCRKTRRKPHWRYGL
jgi:hypothetical protein